MGCGAENRLVVIFLIFTAMSRIHDLPSATPTTSDTIVGTDVSDSNKSVKFTISDVIGLSVTSLTLNDLSDVNAPEPITDGYYLKYESDRWVPAAVSGGGGATTLGGLTNVASGADSASTGQVISYSSGTYVPTTPAAVTGATDLDGLSDVTITSAADGDFLKRVAGTFVNGVPSIADLSEFSLSGGPSANQAFLYNPSTTTFQNTEIGLSALSDASTSGVAKGDILVYDGTSEFTPTRQKVNLNASLVGYDITLSYWLNPLYSLSVDDGSTNTGQMLLNVAFVIPSDLDNWRIEKFKISAYETNATASSEVALTLTKNNTIIDASTALTFSGDGSSTGALVKQTATYGTAPTVSEDDVIGIAGLDSPTPTNLGEFQQVVISIKLIPPA